MTRKVLITLALLLIVFVACSGSTIENPTGTKLESTNMTGNLYYQVIDGMPCLLYDGYKQFGLTCDWSRWNGAVDGQKVIVP